MSLNSGLSSWFTNGAAVLASILMAAGLNQPASAQAPASPGASAPPEPRVPSPAVRAGQVPADSAGRISVWVDLDLPAVASLPADKFAERAALRSRIEAEQDAAMARLRGLGAQEQARVWQVRNALAVWLPAEQIEAARRIPGVRAVRAVRRIDRDPLGQGG